MVRGVFFVFLCFWLTDLLNVNKIHSSTAVAWIAKSQAEIHHA